MKRVEIPSGDPATLALWRSLAEIAEELPGEWSLVGGMMVQLHAYEHGITDVRATVDVDVLAQARPQGTLERLREALGAPGFEQEAPDLDGFAYPFARGEEIVDVLAPEGIVPPPTLGTGQRAIAIPGGSQALSRFRGDRRRGRSREVQPPAPFAARRGADQGSLAGGRASRRDVPPAAWLRPCVRRAPPATRVQASGVLRACRYIEHRKHTDHSRHILDICSRSAMVEQSRTKGERP